MFDNACAVYAFLLDYTQRLMADVPDERLADQPSPGVNHPAWILGHLTIASDYTLLMAGGSKACPEAWHRDFGPGSIPTADRAHYPSKEESLARLVAAHERAVEAVRGVTPERAARRHELDLFTFQTTLPTIGDLLTHLLTSHEAAHVGHLSNWRRQMGSPPLF